MDPRLNTENEAVKIQMKTKEYFYNFREKF